MSAGGSLEMARDLAEALRAVLDQITSLRSTEIMAYHTDSPFLCLELLHSEAVIRANRLLQRWEAR